MPPLLPPFLTYSGHTRSDAAQLSHFHLIKIYLIIKNTAYYIKPNQMMFLSSVKKIITVSKQSGAAKMQESG